MITNRCYKVWKEAKTHPRIFYYDYFCKQSQLNEAHYHVPHPKKNHPHPAMGEYTLPSPTVKPHSASHPKLDQSTILFAKKKNVVETSRSLICCGDGKKSSRGSPRAPLTEHLIALPSRDRATKPGSSSLVPKESRWSAHYLLKHKHGHGHSLGASSCWLLPLLSQRLDMPSAFGSCMHSTQSSRHQHTLWVRWDLEPSTFRQVASTVTENLAAHRCCST